MQSKDENLIVYEPFVRTSDGLLKKIHDLKDTDGVMDMNSEYKVLRELEIKGLRLVIDHIQRVQGHMQHFMNLLNLRLLWHDKSKYSEEELGLVLGKSYYDSLEYMSPEERNALNSVQDALQHHYQNNSHHPEHFEDGILDMSLLDLLEMIADWKAASETSGKNSSFENSIKYGKERFNMPDEIVRIIENTAKELGWIE